MHARLAPFLLLVGLAVACSTGEPDFDDETDATEIINGTADRAHNAVIALLSEKSLCSGTIVKKDVKRKIGWVVTAAHCVKNPPLVAVQTADFSSSDSIRYRVIDYKAHEGYKGQAGRFHHDFAVVRIAGVDAKTPVIPLVGGSDALKAGTAVRSVGFGRTNPRPKATHDNTKRYIVAKKLSTVNQNLIGFDMKQDGICQGDSGGPVLVGTGASERVVGVHSYVQGGCTGKGFSGRVATDAAFFDRELRKALPAESCGLCQQIANSGENECAERFKECQADAECRRFNKCMAEKTAAQCAREVPLGEGPYRHVLNCTCTSACIDACRTETKCAAAPKCGFKMADARCQTCLEGACCEEEADCAADGRCYACLKGKDADPKCAANRPRSRLATCAARRCGAACRIEAPGGAGDEGEGEGEGDPTPAPSESEEQNEEAPPEPKPSPTPLGEPDLELPRAPELPPGDVPASPEKDPKRATASDEGCSASAGAVGSPAGWLALAGAMTLLAARRRRRALRH